MGRQILCAILHELEWIIINVYSPNAQYEYGFYDFGLLIDKQITNMFVVNFSSWLFLISL